MEALRRSGPIVFVLAAAGALAGALGVLGGRSALPPSAQQAAGAVVATSGIGWGLPAATLLVCLASCVALGTLLVAAAHRGVAQRGGAMALAGAASGVATVAGVIAAVSAFAEDSGMAPADTQFSTALGAFLTGTGLGLSWIVTVIALAVVTTLCFAVRSSAGIAVLACAVIVALVPLAGQRFAVGSPGYDVGVTAGVVLLLALAVWAGTAVTLLVVSRERAVWSTRRWSLLSTACLGAAVLAWLISTGVRTGVDLASREGALAIAQLAAVLALAVLGLLHARMMRPRGESGVGRGNGRGAAVVALVQVAVAGAALAATVALGYAGSPTGADTATTGTSPAEILTGDPLPAAWTPAAWVSGRLDAVWLVVVLGLAVAYLAAARRLARSGVRWPVARTVGWLAGLAVLLLATNGPIAVYQRYLFSAQIAFVASLSLVAPLLLATGSPLTLAFAASRLARMHGVYRGLTRLAHSPAAGVLGRPAVIGPILAASLWVWLTSQVLGWSVRSLLGHEVVAAWMLAAGYAFAQSLLGRDPAPRHARRGTRLVVGSGVVASSLGLGLFSALRPGLWAADWFAAMGRTWGLGAVADQHAGGWVFLVVSAVTGVVLLAAVPSSRRVPS